MKKQDSSYGEHLFPVQNIGTVEGQLSSEYGVEEFYSTHSDGAQSQNRTFLGSAISFHRFRLGLILLGSAFLFFFGVIVNMQIVQGKEYQEKAEQNRIRVHVIPAERGIITDRNGVTLAENDPVFQIVATKRALPQDKSEQRILFEHLTDIVGGNVEDMLNLIEEADWDEQVLLVDNIFYEPAIRFVMQNERFDGCSLEVAPQRSYITDKIPSLSHILGYTGVLNPEQYEAHRDEGYRSFDHIGKQGVEAEYESSLRGTFGKEVVEVDALGNTERVVSQLDAISGERLELEIDAGLQKYIEKSIVAHLDGTESTNASVVVMDVHTGSIYAMVSWPAYDANVFTHNLDSETYSALLADERKPLFPRAYAGEFPSGSTIKPTYAAAALIEGIITPSTSFLSVGGIQVGPWFFPDWRAGGHGITDVYHAIADSVNTFFYMIGGGKDNFEGLGVDRLTEYASLFGFGQESGLDIPGEADGFLPSKDWKLAAKGEVWYIGDTYNLSIGQGDFLSTPLQIARATAVFANGGYLVTPRLSMSAPIESEQIIPEETAAVIRDAMRDTVTEGTAQMLNSLEVTSAGKTGTAQWSSLKKNHGWYTGFAPFEDPEIAVAVLVEEGADDYLAVPIVSDIYQYWFSGVGIETFDEDDFALVEIEEIMTEPLTTESIQESVIPSTIEPVEIISEPIPEVLPESIEEIPMSETEIVTQVE